MNLTDGQKFAKEHLWKGGAMTACNRKTSGIGLNNFDDFKRIAERYPDYCCKKCLNRFNEINKFKK